MLEFFVLIFFLNLVLVIYMLYSYFSGRSSVAVRMKYYLNQEKNREKSERRRAYLGETDLWLLVKPWGEASWGAGIRKASKPGLYRHIFH